MKRSFVIWQGLLERLTKEPDLENIILGTGAPAKDLQAKLRLLNLKAQVLVGDRDEPANGLWHYDRLAALDEIARYRFIVCFDADEWMLLSPAKSVLFKRLGVAWNHPRVIFLTNHLGPAEYVDSNSIDAIVHDVCVYKGRSHAVYGDPCEDAFKIHIFGGCGPSSVYRITRAAWPEILYEKLRAYGFPALVREWGSLRLKRADCLLRFLRDDPGSDKDLVILDERMIEMDVLQVVKRNLLPLHRGVYPHPFLSWLENSYTDETCEGLNHDTNPIEIWEMQHRIFRALGRRNGFAFWNIMMPNGMFLPEEQARRLTGLSPGYLARMRRLKESVLSTVGGTQVKDYTDCFVGVDDIFDMYQDAHHLTDKGHEIIAERCARDILRTFGEDRRKKRRA